MRHRFPILILLGVLLCLVGCGPKTSPPAESLNLVVWYWHSPFNLSEDEQDGLLSAGVQDVFVRAASLRHVNGKVEAVQEQNWEPAGRLRIYAVFPAQPTLVKALSSEPVETLAKGIAAGVDRQVRRASEAGIRLEGVQFDLDCPTRLLPKYAELLRAIRGALREEPAHFSATALPTWYDSDDIGVLADAVDELVPQYYENELASTIGEVKPVAHLKGLQRGLIQGEALGRPFSVGIASYGQALVYDSNGTLVAMQRELSPLDLLADPGIELSGSRSVNGELILEFTARGRNLNAIFRGYRLVFTIPTEEVLAKQLEIIRADRPQNLKRVFVFRYPEHGETSTLPRPTLLAGLRGDEANVNIKVGLEDTSNPLEMAEAGLLRVDVWAENAGVKSTAIHRESFVLQLRIDSPALEEIEPASADLVEHGIRSGAGVTAASLRMSDTVRIRKHRLLPGERVKLATLLFNRDVSITGTWTATVDNSPKLLRGEVRSVDVLKKQR